MADPASLLTPTFAGDLQRFALLRESIRTLGIELPHVAVVHTEDLPSFTQVFGGEPGLELVATADVLPARVEQARRRGSGRQPRRPRQLAMRAMQALPGWTASASGWRSQQLVKLLGGEAVRSEHWICLDSDAFFVRGVLATEFFDDGGRLVLNRLVSPGNQQPGPRRASCRLLGLDEDAVDPSVYYVDVPVPMHRTVVADLRQHLEHRHGRPWYDAFLASRATEYMTYGLYAEHIATTAHVSPQPLEMSRLLYSYDPATFPERLAEERDRGTALVMVHSLLPADASSLAAAARSVW